MALILNPVYPDTERRVGTDKDRQGLWAVQDVSR